MRHLKERKRLESFVSDSIQALTVLVLDQSCSLLSSLCLAKHWLQ